MKIDRITGSLLFMILAGVVYFLTQAMFQNMHVVTTNGLWKSIVLREYLQDPGWDRVSAPNALLYPLHATFSTIYDQFVFLPSEQWRRMGMTNGVFGALSAGACYLFAHRWTQSHLIALLASIPYCFAGFVYLHSVTNEDIMPAYFFCLLAMFLAADWFGAPKLWQVAVVSVVLSLGWLVEWRVMFPALPPMCFALAISRGGLGIKFARVGVFLSGVVASALFFASLSWVSGYRTSSEALEYAQLLLWTGKEVDSGWGGFSTDKVWLLFSAMSEAIFGGRYLLDPNWLWGNFRCSILAGLALLSAMAAAGMWYTWRNRTDPTARARFVLFFGLVAAGGVFNAYSQPADPQMQINIMLVALPGWALLISGVFAFNQSLGRAMPVILALMVTPPVAFSHYNLSLHKGGDTQKISYLNELNTKLDLDRTVFVYYDFDGIVTWWVVNYGSGAPTGANLAPAPATEPHFKWIAYVRETVLNPDWSGERHAQDVIDQIHEAMDLGYKIVAPVYWLNDEDYWILSFSSVATRDKASEIYRNLTAAFDTAPLLSSEFGDDIIELRRRP